MTDTQKDTKCKVVTLCGSTRFKKDFMRVEKELTLQGVIVLSLGCFERFTHSADGISYAQKEMVDNLHKRKIDLSDEIYVINPNNYMGYSTKNEIEYAQKKHLIVNYMEEPCSINPLGDCGTCRWRLPSCEGAEL